MKKRLIAFLLTFAVMISVSPATVFALDGMYIPKSGEIPFQVNPLYAGVLDEADFDLPEVKPGLSTQSEDAYVTEAEASTQIREYMKARVEVFTVRFQTQQYDLKAMIKAVLHGAFEHNGDPEAGDYLRWQYGGYRASYRYRTSGSTTNMEVTYTVPYYTSAAQEAELALAVNDLLESPELEGADDYEKVRFFYDYICNNVEYDYDNLNDDTYKLKYTAYAAMIQGTSVCQGYALLLYRLALSVGVDARLIAGIGNGGRHGWNIVELEDQYYNADATWDAPRAEYGMPYEYFLVSDDHFTDHTRDEEYLTESFYAEYPMGTADYVHSVPETPDYVASGVCGDNLIWTLDVEGKLTISGEGEMWDYDWETTPWDDYAFEIHTVAIDEQVSYVDGDAFFGLEMMQSFAVSDGNSWYSTDEYGVLYSSDWKDLIRAPAYGIMGEYLIRESVTAIEPGAFVYCGGLTSIAVPEGITVIGPKTFHNCASLMELTLPEGLLEIGEYAVECAPLESIVFPASLKSIGCMAFAYSSLQEVEFLGDAPTIGEDAFRYVVAEVRYPGNNSTWTEDVMQDYGGNLTWRMIEDQMPSYTPGDINGDGNVNNRDAARLMQYLAGWDVEYVEAALDVNGDGKANNRDAARLMQYLAGWDVTIQ